MSPACVIVEYFHWQLKFEGFKLTLILNYELPVWCGKFHSIPGSISNVDAEAVIQKFDLQNLSFNIYYLNGPGTDCYPIVQVVS